MTPTGPLRLGFVGCGSVVERFHLPALRRVGGIEVVSLADLDPGRCRALAGRSGMPLCHSDAFSLIRTDVDAVAVCVPPHDHARIGLEVLRAGKHLFLEKPIALSLEDADALVEESERRDAVAMTGFNLRAHRLAREACRQVSSGRLGRVRWARAVFTQPRRSSGGGHWRGEPGRGGDPLLDLGVHHFDLLRFVLQAEVEEVLAEIAPDGSRANVTASMSGGAHAELRLGAADDADGVNRLELEGDRGRLAISFYKTLGVEHGALGFRRGAALGPGLVADRWNGGAYPASYRRQWREFAKAIATGSGGYATLGDGRSALAAALAAADSARAGRTVRVGPTPDRMRQRQLR